MGPYPEATAVFDIDSIGLTNLVHRLNHGLDPGGNPIGAPTAFVIGVGANPAAVDLEREVKRFEWKVDAGAEFAITQPVFDARQFEAFLRRIEAFRIPVVAGIWPLVSVRNAEFLANEVPGVSVPDDVVARMRRAQEPREGGGAGRGRGHRARRCWRACGRWSRASRSAPPSGERASRSKCWPSRVRLPRIASARNSRLPAVSALPFAVNCGTRT